MLGFGAMRGETETVLSKAIRLCLECVGIDKKKTKNKNHNKKKYTASNQLAKFRGWIQAGATLLTNIHLPNFFKAKFIKAKARPFVCRV